MRSKNLVPLQVIVPQTPMGSNHSAQRREAFEEALQSSIEASLRTSGTVPSHVFSVLYHRSRPHAIDGQGPSTSHTPSSLLPPPDNADEEMDIKPDVSAIDFSRQPRVSDDQQQTHGSPTTPVRTSNSSPREQQKGGVLPTSRMPPPLLMPVRPNAVTTSSDPNNNANRLMLPRLPSMLPKNIPIEQLKHFQQLQRLQLLHQRHSARAALNSLSIPRLPLFNPLMPALNRNALVTAGSSINGVHPQDSSSSNAIGMTASPGSPMFRKGYCKGGKDIRLSTLSRDGTQIAPFQSEYVLVAMSISPSVPQVEKPPGSGSYHPPDIPAEAMVVVAMSIKCLPPQQHELRPLSARCVGCGKTSLQTFATLSSHINLRTASPSHVNINMSGVNPLLRHARNFVHRDSNMPHGCIRGQVIPWHVNDATPRLPSASMMPMYQQPEGMLRARAPVPIQHQLKYKHGQARMAVPNAPQLRQHILPPGGIAISHKDIKTQPTTSRASPIVVDSPASANDSSNYHKLADDWSPISSAGQSDRSSTSDALTQSRLDPDWNSTVKLPENLPSYVGRPLVLVCWEWQQLQSNIQNVQISHTYAKCYDEAMGDCRIPAVTPLSREICYMVTAQYLTSLEKHEFPTATALSAWLGRSRLMLASMPQIQLLSSHVVSLARMTISNNMHKIGLVISQISQAHAINECIANLRPRGPNMHLVAHINGDTILDLSILLTGHTSRMTLEYLLTSEEYFDIIENKSTSEQTTLQLAASFLNNSISKLSSAFNRSLQSTRTSFLIPQKLRFCNTSTSLPESSWKLASSISRAFSSTSNKSSSNLGERIFDENNNDQLALTESDDASANFIADQLFTKVSSLCEDHTKLDLSSFSSVQCCFILPESAVCKNETIHDITISGALQELGMSSTAMPTSVDLRKIIFTISPKTRQRFNALCEHVKSNVSTLFVMFVTDAHLHCDANSLGAEWMSCLSRDLLSSCRNVLLVSCTNIPHAFLNQNTSIPAQNILFSSDYKTESANLSDHCFSSSPNEIFRNTNFDLPYETESVELLNSIPQCHSASITTNLLTQSYISALTLVISTHRTLSNTDSLPEEYEQKLSSMSSPTTMAIVKSLLTSQSGITVLLRVPSETLAAKITSDLSEVRTKLNMDEAFEIVLYGSRMKVKLSEYFLQLVKEHKSKPDDWTPETLSDIDCIPLLLIYTGKEITSHQMPRTLKYIDLRLLSNNLDSFTQSTILSELSLAHCVSEKNVSIDTGMEDVKTGTAYEPPKKKSKSDSDDDALHMDTFSDESNENSENDESQLKWKSFGEKEEEDTGLKTRDNNRKRSHPQTQPETSFIEKVDVPMTPRIIVTKTLYSYIESYFKGTEKFMDLPTHSSCEWSSHARPIISEKLNDVQTAEYSRKWTRAVVGHPDNSNDSDEAPSVENPRNILLVSPRQVRLPLACCRFMKQIGRMLVKLLQVEVYDHRSSAVVKPMYPVSNIDADPHWPVHASILDMEFDASIRNSEIIMKASRITNGFQDLNMSDTEAEEETATAPCIAGKLCALDVNHRACDACKNTPDQQSVAMAVMTIPNKGLNMHSVCDDTTPLVLNFVIPEFEQDQFVFQHHDENVSKVSALKLKFKDEIGIKTPVFSLAISGAQRGLYNLDHTLAIPDANRSNDDFDIDDSTKSPGLVHIIVIRQNELKEFKEVWPRKVLMALPENFDDLGAGAMKYAVQCVMQHSVSVRQEQHNAFQEASNAGDVWPFALMLDDSAVVWTSCNNFGDSLMSDTLESSQTKKWRNISLVNVLDRIESVPSAERYAAIGIRPWSSFLKAPECEEDFSGDVVSSGFSKCHLASCFVVNAVLTANEMFDCSRFLHEDIDWFMRVAAADLPFFRFNDIAVATKVMTSSTRNKLTTVDCENSQSLVSLADSDFTPLPRHPNLLLELYLGQLGHSVFSKSKGNSRHPVLVVDKYVSLGPEVFVEFVSSKHDASPWSSNTDKSYCGLLLYCQSNDISPSFLQQFRFTSGATVCVVGRDRSSLRQTVRNLNLENDWHFRLTDEYQTANDTGKRKPLFYLTGVARSSG